MAERLCPVCNGPMWSAANSKYPHKEGAPDFRCKDKSCKWKLDKDTGEWVESEYVTAVWLPKPKTPAIPKKSNIPTAAHPVNDSYKTMLLSYSKDIVCAEIAKGIEVKEPFKRVADGFKVLMTAYAHPFGKPPAPKPAEEVPEVDLEEGAEGPQDGEEVPF